MPEGPEVEVLCRRLGPQLLGAKVERVQILKPRVGRPRSEQELRERLEGRHTLQWARRGKYLVAALDGPVSTPLIIHLGMTGRLYTRHPIAPPPRHAAATFWFEDGRELVFLDPRGFGRVSVDPQLIASIAPDPGEPEWDGAKLAHRLSGRRRAIRDLLLDSRLVGGIGNIYANEALFLANIEPNRPGTTLTPDEIEKLSETLQKVFRDAVAFGMGLDLDWEGAASANKLFYFGTQSTPKTTERFYVYDREGAACTVCGASITRRQWGGRPAFTCPNIQAH